MAAVVRCECCGKVVPHTKAIHLRTFSMVTATTYNPSEPLKCADICNSCHEVIKGLLKREAE